ncbi:hypothetical protein QTP86_030300 [Hemibagrus guttatus]|nr:hypothetical protein QTP86_030300 [Hemibagrus guttatus]
MLSENSEMMCFSLTYKTGNISDQIKIGSWGFFCHRLINHRTKCMCFSTAVNTPSSCCFRYQTQAIPVKLVAAYAVTELQCTKSGIIFILKDGRTVCADPDNKWVKNIKNRMDQRLSNSLNKPTKSV